MLIDLTSHSLSFPLIGNLSEKEGLRTSRNARNYSKDVVLLMDWLIMIGYLISKKDSKAALTVFSISFSVCASDMNPASNCEGAI